jgi:tRNA (mo5U34)-methyltransferase
MTSPPAASQGLHEQIAEHDWYHTIELAPGVVTPGWFDTRRALPQLPFPASLAGLRCLDVGTFDGFWAFEMERRGAEEVVAADIEDLSECDWPAGSAPATAEAFESRKAQGRGFALAHEALGSEVRKIHRNIYDLDPATDGEFDFVYVGSLLLHLRDPIGALQSVRGVCRGRLLLVDAVDLGLTALMRQPAATLDAVGRPWWWRPNMAGLVRMVEAAGFRPVQRPKRFYMPVGPGHTKPRITPRLLMSKTGRIAAIEATRGDPHAAILAEAV